MTYRPGPGLTEREASGAYVTIVEHGATAGTARPAGATRVFWRGSVQPTNATQYDRWINTTYTPYVESIYNGTTWAAIGAPAQYADLAAFQTAITAGQVPSGAVAVITGS